MKAEEIRNMSEEELLAKLDQSKTELFNLRFQVATGQLENTSRIAEVRKDIARLLTVQVERGLKDEELKAQGTKDPKMGTDIRSSKDALSPKETKKENKKEAKLKAKTEKKEEKEPKEK